MTLSVKLLEFCEPGELVRIGGQLAIVARHTTGKCVIYISGDNAPCREYITTDQPRLCLSYGMEFDVLPDYRSPCDMATHFMPGSLYYSTRGGRDDPTSRHIAVALDGSETRSLDLDTFSYDEKLRERFVSFRRWAVWMKLPPYPNPILLYGHDG